MDLGTKGTKLLRHIQACNQHESTEFTPFSIHGVIVGCVRHRFAEVLLEWPELFARTDVGVDLRFGSTDLSQRSATLATLLRSLVDRGCINKLYGEQYAVAAPNSEQILVLIDRSAAPYFGIRAFGQHVNGYVESEAGLHMWVGKRASDRLHYPGWLDQMVAGGVPYGLSLKQNLQKECWEEAGIPAALASRAKPVGLVSYYLDTDEGFKPDTLYCYDLVLPEDFSPQCTDGEVAEFSLMPIEKVLELVCSSDEFKPNCNLVLIDFFIRHGYIGPENCVYRALIQGLHLALI